ncbi:GNAT family N-acetyltransferase [Massilia sp. LXY-6]|uniref:GNAT family N-acetyltransferase n=1 Tax=Massilia sp. LXY-6 TaxID=3379823 RepID=UPI003EDF74DF
MKTSADHEEAKYRIPEGKEEIQCYENHIPDFAVEEMDRCYGALYSSIAYLRLAGKLNNSVSTYVAHSKGSVRSVFLFQRDGLMIRVLNSAIRTQQEEVEKFANYIFGRMPEVNRICFSGVHMGKLRASYPSQQFLAGEDIVVPFGGAPEEYTRKMGTKTRRTLKHHAKAFELRHPSLRFEVIRGSRIDTDLTSRIVHWNRNRMSAKNKISAYQDEDAQRFATLAAEKGLAGLVLIDDRICAATLCCRVGSTYYMIMTGHDSEYDEFSPGMLCRYWTAMECMRMNGAEINLMCGRLSYKYRLLGESRKYDSLTIYRNRAAIFFNLPYAIRVALQGYAMEARFALLDCESKDTGAARAVARGIDIWRTSKKMVRGTSRKVS